jgi:hypothetical protein
MADDGFLLIPDNVLGAHAGEEIVRMVVLADMIEAKPPIFALAQPPPWARDGSRAPCNSATRRPGIGVRSRRSLSRLTRMSRFLGRGRH